MKHRYEAPKAARVAGLAVAAILALGAQKAGAATVVNEGGGPYDITTDTLFTGLVEDPDGGAGSYIVDFTSSRDPLPATAAASLTEGVLDTFDDLTMEWQDGSGTALASTPVFDPVTRLETTFASPNLAQSLAFTWTGSATDQGFDFEVSPVPLPAGIWLMLGALGGLLGLRHRRRAAADA
ncbi:VPLPA-CTERM sorting domain-containing protein [Roseovarius sp. D22-M7]|uniref:VPLPA-CTERM sorting domain-containing protein n=1 Tax=Roseovarius sp. D22-M7 TaxID=3127116 RepID=UPI0030100AF7